MGQFPQNSRNPRRGGGRRGVAEICAATYFPYKSLQKNSYAEIAERMWKYSKNKVNYCHISLKLI